MIPQEVISEILSRADIVQIISSYINVIKKGNAFVAVCPFHNDNNPSMQISPTKQIYKCFSCGEGGNVFTFVQKYEKISYLDAVRKVASLINYNSPLLEKKERQVDNKTKDYLKALKDTSNFYHYVISTLAGEKGKEYFLKRNISTEMIDYFSLGFAPENGQLTIKQLRSKGNDVGVLEEMGILVHEKNEFSDRFKNRVIFTLFNEYNEVIGFSGRRISNSDEAKYVNSPSSTIFNKSEVLYNYQNAKNETKREGCCYVVEGFMDVFALYKANIKSSVALMGTAFTVSHARLLKRLNVEIRLCLDGDEAGQHGMMKMCTILDEERVPYSIVDYQGDIRDPDEILNQEGADILYKKVNNLIKKNDYMIKYFSKKFDLKSIDGKKGFISELTKYVFLENDVEKEAFIKELSALTSVNGATLERMFTKKEIFFDNDIFQKKIIKKLDAGKKIQKQLIKYALNNSEAFNIISQSEVFPFVDEVYLRIFTYLEEIRNEKESFTLNDIICLMQGLNEKQNIIEEIIEIDAESYPPYDEDIIKECLLRMKNVLEKRHNQEILNQEAFTLDEIARAKLLDQRKGVENYGKKEKN